jgi:putative FmdB family regulatory protein
MPSYDYKCIKCENVQEEFHSIVSTPSISCKVCGGPCEKIFSPNVNFVLKGCDWPSQGFRMKDQMGKKNMKMKSKMVERTNGGEGVSKMKDLVKN